MGEELKYRCKSRGQLKIAQSFNTASDTGSLQDRLGRTLIEARFNTHNLSFNLNEYYLSRTSENILNFFARYKQSKWRASSGLNLFNTNQQRLETIYLNAQIELSQYFVFRTRQEFDLEDNERVRSVYELQYHPANNCWALLFNFRDTIVDQRFSLNFALNFSGGELEFFNR